MGQYMPSLISEYCSCSLVGKLQPEMKTKLDPALWVVLDVIEPEVMKSMNESMDEDSQSIFRALYGEYKRSKVSRDR